MKYTCDCEIEYFLNAKKILSNNIQMVKLEDYTAVELKKMIKSFNGIVKFGAYSKLKKAGLINMMKTHPKIKIQEGSNAVKISVVAEQETPLVVKEKKETKKSRLKKLKEQADQIEITEEEEEEPKKKKEKEVKADKMDMPKTKIKLPKEDKKELGDFKLDNGFKVKNYDKKKLFKFHRDIYIKYYGKDMSYDMWIGEEKKKEDPEEPAEDDFNTITDTIKKVLKIIVDDMQLKNKKLSFNDFTSELEKSNKEKLIPLPMNEIRFKYAYDQYINDKTKEKIISSKKEVKKEKKEKKEPNTNFNNDRDSLDNKTLEILQKQDANFFAHSRSPVYGSKAYKNPSKEFIKARKEYAIIAKEYGKSYFDLEKKYNRRPDKSSNSDDDGESTTRFRTLFNKAKKNKKQK